jgi:hypothetical protein
MSKKRRRSSLDVLGNVDDLFAVSEAHSPAGPAAEEEGLPVDTDSPRSSQAEEGHFTISPFPQKRCGVLNSGADAVSSPASPSIGTSTSAATTTANDSLGGDEIDLLRRKDEEMADMALFLARAVSETPSQLSIGELVAFLERAGVARVLLSLKRGEATESFVHSLFLAHPQTALRAPFLRLLMEFTYLVDVSVFFERTVIAFLVESLTLSEATAQPPAAAPLSPVRTAGHWSTRKKRVPPSVVATTSPVASTASSVDELNERVRALCTASSADASPPHAPASASTAASTALLALQALLTLVFEYNRSLLRATPWSGFSVPLLFVHAGGLERVGELLNDDCTRDTALALLEVLTASDVLHRDLERLRTIVPTLMSHLNDTSHTTQVSVLKVLTNATHLLPCALHDNDCVGSFVEFMRKVVLLHPAAGASSDVDERETFALCCAINVVKYEAEKGLAVSPTFTRAFMACDNLLSALASSMTRRYHCNEAEQLVLSGYAALLLAALSLVDLADMETPSLRVRVITAVASASRGTRIGKLTDTQPMRMVAAIIQEFLLFQSASGTLTKEAFVEMDSLVGRIQHHNHIAVTAATDEVEQSGGNNDNDNDEDEDDDDDITLGELL